jgi:hypothetical protein
MPAFRGQITIKSPGGKVLSAGSDNVIAFSEDTVNGGTKFSIDESQMSTLVGVYGSTHYFYNVAHSATGNDGKKIELTQDRRLISTSSSKHSQGSVQAHGRPGDRIALAVSGYPWQDGQTWFLSTSPTGAVHVKKVEDETCHFSAEEHPSQGEGKQDNSGGKQGDQQLLQEILPPRIRGNHFTIRNRQGCYMWVSENGEIHTQPHSPHDDVTFFLDEDGYIRGRGKFPFISFVALG